MTLLFDGLSSIAPATMKKVGLAGAMRYVRPDRPDGTQHPWAITKTEYDSYINAGLEVGLVWEAESAAPLGGKTRGIQDAIAANTHADRLPFPINKPIFYAVDFQVTASQWRAVEDYFKGAASVKRRPVAAYGGYATVEYLARNGLATHLWQTEAWSGGLVSDKACLLQTIRPAVSVPGVDIDTNVILKPDHGTAVRPARVPPVLTHTLTPGDPDAPMVKVLQVYLIAFAHKYQADDVDPGYPDGVFGPKTAAAVVAFKERITAIQETYHQALTFTEINSAVGPVTLNTLMWWVRA